MTEGCTTFAVVDGQTKERVVSNTPSVVEISAVETTVDITEENGVASITPTSITVEIGEATTDSANGAQFSYTVKVNGEDEVVTGTTDFVTTWTFSATTLSLSFSERQTAFIFSGEVTTEIAIPAEHTHVTVNGIETAVDLPGLTTMLTVSDSTNVIVQLPAVSTEVTVTEETYEFTWQTYQITDENSKGFCGTYSLSNAAGQTSDYCVPGLTTTIVLPTGATQSTVFLRAESLQTTFSLQGITTTLIPEQTITIVKDGSTETSIIPAVVSSYVTTISSEECLSESETLFHLYCL